MTKYFFIIVSSILVFSCFENKYKDSKYQKTFDSTSYKLFAPNFIIKKDEFSENKICVYLHKSFSIFDNVNSTSCYFTTSNEGIQPLRFNLKFYNDDWIFIKHLSLLIDSNVFTIYPIDIINTDTKGGMISEIVDEDISYKYDLIKALYRANNVKIKIYGSQYYDIRTVSKKELNAIKETISLYKIMGGKCDSI